MPTRRVPKERDLERVATYQIALERLHFSSGFIDGTRGMRTRRAVTAFQQARGLPVSGEFDEATCAALDEPVAPFLTYTVTTADEASVQPTPKLWKEKAEAKVLGYNDLWESLAEKFHCAKGYLQGLNRDIALPQAGATIIVPNSYTDAPLPKAKRLRIYLQEAVLQAEDEQGRVYAHFPCSIAADKNKRPEGQLKVINYAPNPDYTFNPKTLPEVAQAEGITTKLVLPPGPNGPVGTVWIGLNLPGYGMHGTPEPEDISRTQSHGCFRLSNWNAEKTLKMISIGTPVEIMP